MGEMKAKRRGRCRGRRRGKVWIEAGTTDFEDQGMMTGIEPSTQTCICIVHESAKQVKGKGATLGASAVSTRAGFCYDFHVSY
jgi:hypothetical protein